jgi:uncharacterized membrane protein YedE/YeeE
MATEFTPYSGLLGGALIGLASVLLLWLNGRIAGISGILGGLLTPTRRDLAWRVLFIGGLIFGGALWPAVSGSSLEFQLRVQLPIVILAGFCVGLGTRMAGGCTSGHGVCGIARGAQRSLVATAVFMTFGMLTVFVTR